MAGGAPEDGALHDLEGADDGVGDGGHCIRAAASVDLRN
jgi:hypothetical protein